MPNLLLTTKVWALTFLMIFLLAACHNYYMARSLKSADAAQASASVDSLQKTNRYFILRSGDEAFAIKNISLSEDQKTASCSLDTLPTSHKLHLTQGVRGKMIYKRSSEEGIKVLNEVHLYTPYDSVAKQGKYTLALDKVYKIEVIEKDKKKTTSSYVIGTLGYTIGAFAVVAIIVAATKSSCPFISAYDGNDFSLQGEVYGGSIYPQLARHDYIPLKMSQKNDGSLQLKITNELKERQYTDMAELLVISHDKNSRVLSDEKGNLYSIKDQHEPISARLGKKDVLSSLAKAGDNDILYMDDSSHADARNDLILKFDIPHSSSKGKLVLSLKNSYWLDLLYGELAKGFGSYYAKYIEQQRSKPATELLKWVKDQQIPLEVSVKTPDGWKTAADITTIGPLANREIVVPIDLASAGSEAEIKLSSGFMFWEIDHAAMDFSVDNDFTVERLTPLTATDEKEQNVLSRLEKEDGIYLEQPDIGNAATLTYKSASIRDATKAYTYILHVKGYYEHIRDFQNKPDIKFLSQFKQPNAFPVFGLELYKKFRGEGLSSLVSNR